MLNNTKLTVLNGHYEDTHKIIGESVKNRDRNFFFILVLLGVMAFQSFSPEQSSSILTQIVQRQLGVDATISINYIGSLFWFGLFAVAIRYFQGVINLEKQYNYIHALEIELAKEYDGKAFTREGKAYLYDYPKFSKWMHIVYRRIFPSLLCVATTGKIINEWQQYNVVSFPLLLNTIVYALMVISTVLYVISVYKLEKS